MKTDPLAVWVARRPSKLSDLSWSRTVNWGATGAAGEVLGAIAVLVTLIYLATQVRQSNNLARFNATTEIINQFNELNRLVSTDHALRKVLSKSNELLDDEREQVYNFAMMFCNVWVSAQIGHDNKQIDDEIYAACAKDVRIELARWPTFQQGVEHWLSNYPEHAERPIFQPVVRPEFPPQDAAV